MDRSFLSFCKPCFMEAFDEYGRSMAFYRYLQKEVIMCNGERKMTEMLCPFFFDLQFTNPCWLSKSKSAVSIRTFDRQWRTFLCLCVGSLGLTHKLLYVGGDNRQAEVAVQVWQPQAVRARHQEVLEQQPVNAVAQQRSLQMEVKVCRERIQQFALSRVS